ncbi:hypothetical protein T10_4731 [Trichinella papuae]|uniref:Uncharacterized protein n=1 Tax=Trichinella papuae TaxID=268474 RepID=A0A0V1MWC7_9BILA|nr:hypothetical protein T10_4731 [Trichinella papuae]
MNRSKIGCSQAAQLAIGLLIQFNDGKEKIVHSLNEEQQFSEFLFVMGRFLAGSARQMVP